MRYFYLKTIIALVVSIVSFSAVAQTDSTKAVREILAFQKKLNEEYKDKSESPLDAKAFRKFKGHPFFAINLLYRVSAKLTVTPANTFFSMKTTTSRLPNYRVYGIVEFTLNGKTYKMPVYQSEDLMKRTEYADHLFFPFTDLTSGKTSYGGGRFIDLRIPKGEEIIIDFNQSYNPYCAYNHRYSCPIVPGENYFDIEIPAGVMYNAK